MSYGTVSVRMDSTLKSQFERFCSDVGMNISTAITMFVKKVVNEQKIPFEVSKSQSADPYWDEGNLNYMKKAMEAEKRGEFKVHEIIEV